ncbi:MAG: histone deacetylase family protein [Conchiformibius sp.]|nr:histone deacetylase family protein [Conchiformibius sp.]
MSVKQPMIFRKLVRYARFCKRRLLRLIGWKGRTVWLSSVHCETAFAGENHPENPGRIAAVRQALKKNHLWALLQKVEAREVSDLQLARVHPRRYLRGLENSVPQSGSIKIDEDTYMGKDTLTAARYAAGAVVQAVDMVMRRHAKNAFCAVRPPGHHAAADKASGFCFINNVAVGVMHALAEYRLRRIAVIDFDLHHGDGIEDIFQNDPRVMLLSSFEYPLYPFRGVDGAGGGNPNISNTPLAAGDGSEVFRRMVRSVWLPKLASFQPQIIFLAAGFDAHRDDELGHLMLEAADFEWLTRKIVLIADRYANGRIVSVLEGGYNPVSLAACGKAHIASLIRAGSWF